VVEKILAAHEHLPEDWPVQGTTGYDFSFAVNGLFVYLPAERELNRIYEGFIREHVDFEELLYRTKREIVTFHLSSELTVLSHLLDGLAEMRLETRDFTLSSLRDALLELVAAFPVYRTYLAHGEASAQDRQYIDWAVRQAERRRGERDEGALGFIQRLLLGELPGDATEEYRLEVERFCGKLQQLTAPAMAKALEDTCFYRYVRLVSLNEVGGDPMRFGLTPAAFHRLAQIRREHWPHSLLATSTHDSKRSEDVRARINVLTEMPEVWRERLSKWRRFNTSRRRVVADASVPSRNEEYLLYQTLIGTWPAELGEESPGQEPLREDSRVESRHESGADPLESYRARIEAYMIKALREAKVRTSWTNPNEEYEAAFLDFLREVLTPATRDPFLDDLDGLVRSIAAPGYLNGLGQTLLKLTAPGVPDIYRGCELWDFSLVDPDNRRPIDYGLRQRLLDEIEDRCADPRRIGPFLDDVLRHLGDGRAKLYLIWRTLNFRKAHPALFAEGGYLPLEVSGPRDQHVIAFARRHESETLVVAAARWFTRLGQRVHPWPEAELDWGDTRIAVPSPGTYHHLLAGETLETAGDEPSLPAARLFARFPAALLVQTQE
jgi:(1->4)-alpha-D-glucan 1-alpha-D-glucosylmutase